MSELPPDVVGVRARGKVTRSDYEQVVEPLLERARSEGARLRFLFHFAPDFEGFTPAAVWEDTKVGLRHVRRFERCAVVSDTSWIRASSRAVGALLPMPVRVFGETDLDAAIEWLRAPSASAALSFRVLPERGVVVIEPHAALRREDFDALAEVVDPWLEGGGRLRGVVVHAERAPGWADPGSFLRNLRFVHDRHRDVARVALAMDGQLAELTPVFVDHFVAAAVRRFPARDLEQAIAWAAGEDGDA